jgi:hypothetical protein
MTTGLIRNRWHLALSGALGGTLIWAATEAAAQEVIGARLAEALAIMTGVWLYAGLALAGPIGPARAVPRALALALAVAALGWLAGLRHDEGIAGAPLSVLALAVAASLTLPYLIAAVRGAWRDYPQLFAEAWSIVVRYAAAWSFVGVVWLVIFLSDQVLQLVRITAIGDLVGLRLVGMALTGAALGLGMAVVQELSAVLAPYLILRLLRLLLPVVLAVTLVFLLALPVRGIEGLFDDLSPTLVLLALLAAGIALVAIAVDQGDAEAARGGVVGRSAQGLSLLLPVLAGLALWALGLRVGQHGWTPERLFVALIAGLGLAYGLTYALSVLRGAGWQARIRGGNTWLGLAGLGLAVLWLTPLLNAEAIAARSQLARFDAGRTALADLDPAAFARWGRPGAEALATLEDRARAPGQEALAARLSGAGPTVEDVPASDLSALIAVQPPGATATRDLLLAAAAPHQRTAWAAQCRAGSGGGGGPVSCLMIVADLLPDRPGEEGLLVLGPAEGYRDLQGLFLDDAGQLATRSVYRADGGFAGTDEIAGLLAGASGAVPPVTPLRVNQLGTGPDGLFFLP